jgi:hypothetical protein
MTIADVLERLQQVRRNRSGWMARCPAHHDRSNSLSVRIGVDDRTLIKCFAGCSVEVIVGALGLELKDLFANDRGRAYGQKKAGSDTPGSGAATLQQQGCTLMDYAEAKRLPATFLRTLGLSDIRLPQPAVRIPYLDSSGVEVAVRLRVGLEGTNRFRWKSGSKPVLYGLWRLELARQRGFVVLVEGESDAHTLWLHEIPAIGLPGANSWREEWAATLDGVTTVYVLIEPDRGGTAVLQWLSTSSIRHRVRLVSLATAKDPSNLYLEDPPTFLERWTAAIATTAPWSANAQAEADKRTEAARARCGELLAAPSILERFTATLSAAGVAGEHRAAALLYLIITTRFLQRPVSAALKGPSSAGKSYLVARVLEFFPPNAYYALSAMSERALAYSKEPLAHRFLVIYEAAGLKSDFGTYLIRSLLSEGRVRYETVEKTAKGVAARLIEREGPTGLLVTTTALRLHDENETRLFSIAVTDTAEQTRAVMREVARDVQRIPQNLDPWHAFQEWLEHAEHRVVVPYALTLAELIPPVAVRLRRDFAAVLILIKTHAMLHQTRRSRDENGAIVATPEDYATVLSLVEHLVAEGIEATVAPTVRETVEAVRELAVVPENAGQGVAVAAVARRLKLDRSAAWRRVHAAIDKSYLKNLEDRRGRPARVVPGDSLPEDLCVLPTAASLQAAFEAHGRCAVAPQSKNTASLPQDVKRRIGLGSASLACNECGEELLKAGAMPVGDRVLCPRCHYHATAESMPRRFGDTSLLSDASDVTQTEDATSMLSVAKLSDPDVSDESRQGVRQWQE